MGSVQQGTRASGSLRASRSGIMIACLRDNLLYSEKRARDLLFQMFEQILADRRPPAILSRLTREAAWHASRAGMDAGYIFHNWEPASRAVSNAMLNAGVLLDENGARITPGLHAQAAHVVRVDADFRDRTEAYLIEFLIARLGDVSTRDHKALAHALFRQFDPAVSMEDLEDRAVLLLARLSDRVSLRDDGVYIKNSSPLNVV